LISHAEDYIQASAPCYASASMGNAAIYPQRKMSRSQNSLVSIPIPSSTPVS